MRIWNLIALGLLFFVQGAIGNVKKDILIFPNPTEKIAVLEVQETEGSLPIGVKLTGESLLYKAIMAELDLPFHQSLIKLNQCSRNFSANVEGPNVLFVSKNEGGYPRHGLILKDQDRFIEYPELNYVDLVLDPQRIERGDLDIYSHELGHVMMMNILEDFPEGKSVKQHVSMGVTDYPTAFFEGWGIHFQRLVHDNINLYRDAHTRSYDYSRSTGNLWHSNVDEELRLNAVLQNRYIYRKLLPSVETSDLGEEELILLEHATPIFDRLRLKNAQQMLSCEGVLATLFLRINTNGILQDNYSDTSFYERFLLSSMPEKMRPQDLFTPFENVILKNFWVWSRIQRNIRGDSVLFIEFIKEWSECFPEDKEEILRLFILTTVGRTLSDDLALLYEKMAYYGIVGDVQNFRNLMPDYTEIFRNMMTNIVTQGLSLDENIGPQLWIKNENFYIRRTLWDPQNKVPLLINLNTASAYDLATFPGIDLDDARNIVKKREELGFFSSLDQAGFSAELIKEKIQPD